MTLFATTKPRLQSTVTPGGMTIPQIADLVAPSRFCGNCRHFRVSSSRSHHGTCEHPAILVLRLVTGSLPSSLRVTELGMHMESGADCPAFRAEGK